MLLYYKIFLNLIFYNSLFIFIFSLLDIMILNVVLRVLFLSFFVYCILGSFIERRKLFLNFLFRKFFFIFIRVEYLYEVLKKDINKNRNIF